MVDAYQNREWAECAHQLQVMREHDWNKTLTDLYAERIKQPMPQGDWDGVERKTTK